MGDKFSGLKANCQPSSWLYEITTCS